MTAQCNLFFAAAIGFLVVSPTLADDVVKEQRMRRVLGALDMPDGAGTGGDSRRVIDSEGYAYAVPEKPNGAALGSLRGLGSSNELFMDGRGDPALGVTATGLSPLANGNSTLGTAALPQADGGQSTVLATVPRVPANATAFLADGGARGGTNLYGFMRDPRSTTTTPAGLRFADPMLVQTIKGSQNPAFLRLTK